MCRRTALNSSTSVQPHPILSRSTTACLLHTGVTTTAVWLGANWCTREYAERPSARFTTTKLPLNCLQRHRMCTSFSAWCLKHQKIETLRTADQRLGAILSPGSLGCAERIWKCYPNS